MKKNNFVLIGAAGYVAPRHMRAIKDNQSNLLAALDVNDSVGIIDSYFPNAEFFTEFERFDRYVDKVLRRDRSSIQYVSICSPNYLHDAHIRFALRSGLDAICEKPVVLNPWNIDGLLEIEKETGRKVNTILQLRLHPSIVELREEIQSAKSVKRDVTLTYVTSRGRWYMQSWKGDVRKSGGVASNIGVHFFDMLHFLFGELQMNKLHYATESTAGGYLEYTGARVRWFLSVEERFLPKESLARNEKTYRSIVIDGKEVEFSSGFTDLHTTSYERVLAGEGFGLEENRTAIETVSGIRHARPSGLVGDFHPFLKGH